jgi:ribonuclease HIII
MTTLHVQVPESLFAKIQDLAAREQVSVDEFAASALTEKVEALAQFEHFQQRAARGNREKFLRAMSKVPHVPPIPPDEPPPAQ